MVLIFVFGVLRSEIPPPAISTQGLQNCSCLQTIEAVQIILFGHGSRFWNAAAKLSFRGISGGISDGISDGVSDGIAFLSAYANNARKEEEWKEYCRTFDMISKELFEDNRLDKITRAEFFLRGLPPIAQRKVVEKCQINSDEPEKYDYRKWATQAMRLVDSTITLDSVKQEGHVTELYDKVSKLYEKSKRTNAPKVEILQREPYLMDYLMEYLMEYLMDYLMEYLMEYLMKYLMKYLVEYLVKYLMEYLIKCLHNTK